MLKSQLIAVLGSQQAIAELLGITKGAVSQWPEEVPRLRQYELRERRPSIDAELAALSTSERAA